MNNFYLTNNHGILEAHTSEDEYVIPAKSVLVQLIELIWG